MSEPMTTPDPRPEIARRLKILDSLSPGECYAALKFLIGHSPEGFDAAVELIAWAKTEAETQR